MERTEITQSQIAAAVDELTKDKREYFCVECGRPRKHMYCPWNAQHSNEQRHVVMSRRMISLDNQTRLFLTNSKGEKTRHVFK